MVKESVQLKNARYSASQQRPASVHVSSPVVPPGNPPARLGGSSVSLDRASAGPGGGSVAPGSALSGQRNTLSHIAALPDTQNPYNKYATNGDGDRDSIDDGIHMGGYRGLLSDLCYAQSDKTASEHFVIEETKSVWWKRKFGHTRTSQFKSCGVSVSLQWGILDSILHARFHQSGCKLFYVERLKRFNDPFFALSTKMEKQNLC